MSLASGEGKRMGIFDSLIVAYLFLGSTGGGALAVLSLLEVLNSPRLAARRWLLPAEFFARAWAACAIVLGLSVVCLLADLGRIDRAFFLFTASTPSAIAVGAWSLAVACALSTVFACANMLEMWDLREKLAVPGGVLGVLIGVVVVAYTGILLAGLPSVDAWQTPLIPALFVLSGISCGVALCLGAWAFVECRAPLMGSFIALSRVDSAAVAVEAACLVACCLAVRFADYVSGRFRARCGRFAVAVLDRPCGVRPGHSACARAFAHIRQRAQPAFMGGAVCAHWGRDVAIFDCGNFRVRHNANSQFGGHAGFAIGKKP